MLATPPACTTLPLSDRFLPSCTNPRIEEIPDVSVNRTEHGRFSTASRDTILDDDDDNDDDDDDDVL